MMALNSWRRKRSASRKLSSKKLKNVERSNKSTPGQAHHIDSEQHHGQESPRVSAGVAADAVSLGSGYYVFPLMEGEEQDIDGNDACVHVVATTNCVRQQHNPLLGWERPLGDSTDEEKGVQEILTLLSESDRSEMPDTRMPIRHYRAEKGDVRKAVVSLQSALQWRRSFGVNRLVPNGMQDPTIRAMLRVENATGKVYVRGHDREGRALMYMKPGLENTQNELLQMQHLVWNLEKAIACTAYNSQRISGNAIVLDKINILVDYENFKLTNAPPLSTAKYSLDILQKYYPERLYRAYLLNPPIIFRVFWNMVKPFVDPVTKEKVVICTSGAAGCAKLLQAVENVHKLEAGAGGVCPIRPFKSEDYLSLPFHVSFDE